MLMKDNIVDSEILFKIAQMHIAKNVDYDFNGNPITDFMVLYWGPLWKAIVRLAQATLDNKEKIYTDDEKLEIAYKSGELNLLNGLLEKTDYKILTHGGYKNEVNQLLSFLKTK
jgi:intein/homing endonuclease